jgi:hypothetical protein
MKARLNSRIVIAPVLDLAEGQTRGCALAKTVHIGISPERNIEQLSEHLDAVH